MGRQMANGKNGSVNAEPRPCDYCGDDRVSLRRTIAGNGSIMYFWYCAECRWHARKTDQWVGHAVIAEMVGVGLYDSPEDIPIHVDYKSEFRCEICGRHGAEYHHWAPRSMARFFGDDWVRWPGAYLCKAHHDLWHEVVTPYLHGRRSKPRAQEVVAWVEGRT